MFPRYRNRLPEQSHGNVDSSEALSGSFLGFACGTTLGIPKHLVRNHHAGQKRPGGGFVVEFTKKAVYQPGYLAEQASIMPKKQTE